MRLSYMVQDSWETPFIGQVVFYLAPWKKLNLKYSSSCIVHLSFVEVQTKFDMT